MAQISFSDLVNGVVPDASDFNDRYNALKNRINNGMEQDNLAAGSVTTAKIVAKNVTGLKLGDDVVSAQTLVTAVSTDHVLIADASDSGNVKKALVSDLASPASSAEVKTGTEAAKYVAPSTLVSHEGVCKGWINFNGTGTIAINDSYNVSGIVDNGTGDYTVTWDTDFGSVNYSVIGSAGNGSNTYPLVNLWAIAAGSVQIKTFQVGTGETDFSKVCLIAIGDR